MHLVRFDPFDVLREFDRAVDRRRPAQAWWPAVDIYERGTDLVIRAELAGTDPDAVTVTVENGVLTIQGSRSFELAGEGGRMHRNEITGGDFRRTVRLTEAYDAEAVTARFERGILEVTVPRRAEVVPRKVAIEIA